MLLSRERCISMIVLGKMHHVFSLGEDASGFSVGEDHLHASLLGQMHHVFSLGENASGFSLGEDRLHAFFMGKTHLSHIFLLGLGEEKIEKRDWKLCLSSA